MPQPSIRLLGAYRLPVTSEVIEEAMQTWYGSRREQFSEVDEVEAQEYIRDELTPTVLFELEAHAIDERFSIDDFGQPDSDQAAWQEKYLELETGAVLGERLDPPPVHSFRLLFYLHFVDTTKPLVTSYGSLRIPAILPMPERLWKVTPYQAVD